jgi:MFS family permease
MSFVLAAKLSDHSFARRLLLLLVGSMTVMAGATIAPAMPALQAHFADVPGSGALIQYVLTVPGLFIALCAPFAGVVLDRFGRLPLLYVSLVLYVVAGGAGLVLDDLTSLLVSRALLGVAVAGTMTTAITLVGDYFTGDARQKFMGIQNAFMSFGGVVFLSLGGVLAQLHWRGPFAIYLLPALFLPFLALHLVEPPKHQHHHAQGGSAPLMQAPMARIAALFTFTCLFFADFYLSPVKVPFLITELGATNAAVAGMALAAATLASGTASMVFPKVRALLGQSRMVAVGLMSMAVGQFIMSQAPTPMVVVAGLVLVGVGLGWIMPNITLWLMGMTPPQLRGRIMGGLTTAIFLGQFISPEVAYLFSLPTGTTAGIFSSSAVVAAVAACGFGVASLRRI